MLALCILTYLTEVKVKVKSLSRVQLFATLWTVAYQAPLSMGFSRQEYWSGLPFPSPGDLPDAGIEPGSPAFQADALASEPPIYNVVLLSSDSVISTYTHTHIYYICCCCSVAQSCLTLCNPADCRTPGFSVFHTLTSLNYV